VYFRSLLLPNSVRSQKHNGVTVLYLRQHFFSMNSLHLLTINNVQQEVTPMAKTSTASVFGSPNSDITVPLFGFRSLATVYIFCAPQGAFCRFYPPIIKRIIIPTQRSARQSPTSLGSNQHGSKFLGHSNQTLPTFQHFTMAYL
jgi:hypothetical protein